MAEDSRSPRSHRAKPEPAPAEPETGNEETATETETASSGSQPAELGREEFARLRRILRRKYH